MPFEAGNQVAKLATGIPKSRGPRIITQHLIALLNEVDQTTDVRKVRRFCEALLAKALEGDVQAMNSIMDRVDGKVPQPIAGDPENPLVIERVIHEIVKAEPIVNSGYLPEPSFNARNPQAS